MATAGVPRVVHICSPDKFIPEFVRFVRGNFDAREHEFVLWGKDPGTGGIPCDPQLWRCRSPTEVLRLAKLLYACERVLIHGLFDRRLVQFLAPQSWVLRKSYWFIWGWDLYLYRRNQLWEQPPDFRWRVNEFFRRKVIRGFGHLVTQIRGDYELAREWYGAVGEWHDCFMYPSNLFRDAVGASKPHSAINIQVGNSGDPSNRHAITLRQLAVYRDANIMVYTPLSYGRQEYIQEVERLGRELFGDKFVSMREFMAPDQYRAFLAGIDIAVFNHQRQQAMGNTTTLLGLGKKVFMRSDVTPWAFYTGLGVTLYDVEHLNAVPIDPGVAAINRAIVSGYFCEARLVEQLRKIIC